MPKEFSKERWATSPRELFDYIRKIGFTDVKYNKWLSTYLKTGKTDVLEAAT